jgi:hypothetical protein
MNINGKNGLACLTNMNTLPGTITLKPLPGRLNLILSRDESFTARGAVVFLGGDGTAHVPRRARHVGGHRSPHGGTLSDGALKSTSAFARFISEALFLDAAEALELIVRMAPELVPGTQKAHFLVLSLTDEPMLTLAASGGAIAPSPLAFPVTDGVCGYVARSGMSVIEPDASAHLSYSLRFEAELLGRSPVLCLPVGGGRPVHASAVAADGSTPAPLAGVLVLCGSFGARFGEQELLVARALLDLVRARIGSSDGQLSAWATDVGSGGRLAPISAHTGARDCSRFSACPCLPPRRARAG